MLQLCLVYWFAGTAKLNELWLGFSPDAIWNDPGLITSASFGGEAIEYAMHYDIYAKPLAGLLSHAPWLLRLLCIGTLALEIIGPCLLFIPFGTRWARLTLIAAFALLHIGIELTLHVGMFSWVSLAAWGRAVAGHVLGISIVSWQRCGRFASATGFAGVRAGSTKRRVGLGQVHRLPGRAGGGVRVADGGHADLESLLLLPRQAT